MKKNSSFIIALLFGAGILLTACCEQKTAEGNAAKTEEKIENGKEISDDKIVDVKEAVEKESKELIDESGDFDVNKLENMIEDEK